MKQQQQQQPDKTNWIPLPYDDDLLRRPGYDYGANKENRKHTVKKNNPIEALLNHWVDVVFGGR